MSHLFKTELLRHFNWMMIFAVAHFFVLYYLFSLRVSFTNGTNGLDWIWAISIAAGIFGAFQMKLHRRSNDWVYLLHRPLPPAKIHLALTLAGSTLLVMTLLLPALLMLAVLHIDGRFGTELRHYQMLAAGGAMVLTAYGLGQFAVLGASRLAFSAMGLGAMAFEPFVPAEHLITHTAIMLLALVIAHMAFKADPCRQHERAAKLLLSEVPIMIGCYLLLVNFFSIYVTSQIDCDFSPNITEQNSCPQFSSNSEQLQFALSTSTHPDAMSLIQQSMLSEVVPIASSQRSSYPQPNQLPVRDAKLYLMDTRENIAWLFSHSDMLYTGRDIATGALTGWLAPDGFYTVATRKPAIRFSSVPLAVTNDYLIDDHHIYQIDWQRKKIRERFVNSRHERFSDSLFVGENIATLFSDQHLFIFSASELRDFDVALSAKAVMDITSAVESGIPFSNNDVTELSNGYLVMARLNAPHKIAIPELVTAPARLQVWRTLPDRGSELITDLPLTSPYSEFAMYASYISAPGIHVLLDIFEGFKLRKSKERTFPLLYADFPAWAVTATLVVGSSSAGIVAWLLRRSRLPARIRHFWIVMCGLTGLAGLLAFLGGHYWRGRETLKLPLRAPAGAPA